MISLDQYSRVILRAMALMIEDGGGLRWLLRSLVIIDSSYYPRVVLKMMVAVMESDA